MTENVFIKPLVLFDLVATLTDAGPRYVRAFQDIMQRYGFEAPATEEILTALGNKNLSEITDHFTSLAGQDKAKFMDDCNHQCDALLWDKAYAEKTFEGVKQAIAFLKKTGYEVGVFTGTREDAMQVQLAYHDLIDLFSSDMLRGKNNQRDGMVKSIDLKTAQIKSLIGKGDFYPVFVIGDSLADKQAAEANGAIFIGFAPDVTKRAEMEKIKARIILEDFNKLPDLLAEIIAVKQAPDLVVQKDHPAPDIFEGLS